jgi:hypothetical protein
MRLSISNECDPGLIRHGWYGERLYALGLPSVPTDQRYERLTGRLEVALIANNLCLG